MNTFLKSVLIGLIICMTKYFLWKNNLTFWEIGLISVSGLIAGLFFILASMFRSALIDYKEADKSICTISGKISSMNDININASLVSKNNYSPRDLSNHLIDTLKIIKEFLEGKNSYSQMEEQLNQITYKASVLDSIIAKSKVSRFQQYQDHLRNNISYLVYGKSLHFAKVGYIFLYFFIITLITLQLFSNTQNILLECIFIFSLSTVLIFFANLIHDLDRPFKRKKAAFKVNLTPLDLGIESIRNSIQNYE